MLNWQEETLAASAPSAAEKWTPAPSITKPSAAPQVVMHASKAMLFTIALPAKPARFDHELGK